MIHRPATVPAAQRANAMPPVVEFDSSGKLLAAWGGPGAGFEWPEREHGIYAGQNGRDLGEREQRIRRAECRAASGQVRRHAAQVHAGRKFLLQIGHSGKSTGDADHDNVKQAADMVVFKNELYVADGYGNHRVAVFDATRREVQARRGWLERRRRRTTSCTPSGCRTTGMVYVADRDNKRVQVFTTAGDFKQEVIVGADTPYAIGRGTGVFARSGAAVSVRRRHRQQRDRTSSIGKSLKIAGLVRERRNGARRVRHRPRDRDGFEGQHLYGGVAHHGACRSSCLKGSRRG